MDAPSETPTSGKLVARRIASEPSHARALCKLLAYCREPRTADDIDETMSTYSKASPFPPRVILSWLVEAGGIKELQPKILKGPGGNESEGGGASKPMFQTTDEGEAALAEHDAMRLLCELVDASGPHRSVYMQLLDACTITRDTAYLSHLLENDFSLESSKLYPAFFIDKLEKAGGLSWDGGWNTTEDGRAFLASANETK